MTSIGADFVAQSATTFGMDDPATVGEFRQGNGLTNAPPLVGPVVIHEFMYHPPGDLDIGNGFSINPEYIELYNFSDEAVPLHDPEHPTNRWAVLESVTFTFPSGLSMPPKGYLLVVPFDPLMDAAALSAFRHEYGVPDTVPIHGPFEGRLDNSGESLALFKPDPPEPSGPDAGLVPMVLVERINYSPLLPWPGGPANGAGASLQRIQAADYGNDPVHWKSAQPAAGRANLPIDLDTDGDGMPDWWELANELDPGDPSDALLDSDGNGVINREEFIGGTDPHDPLSRLEFESILMREPDGVSLEFRGRPGRGYTVEYRTAAGDGAWQILEDVPLDWTTRLVEVIDASPPSNEQRYYRIVTPPR
jgi:hypothetical protein